ncbi:MAG: hypothetical protein RSC08_02195, partial [Oscillospiraceae bacterium]
LALFTAGARQIAGGYDTTLTLMEDPAVVTANSANKTAFDPVKLLAWGDNAEGQLGNYGISQKIPTGTPVDYDNTVAREIATGVVVTDPNYDYMQKVTVFSAGAQHMVLAREDGTVFAAGNNNMGQLGDYTTKPYEYPVVVGDMAFESLIAKGTTDRDSTLRDLSPQIDLLEDEKVHFSLANMGAIWNKGFNLLQHVPVQSFQGSELKFTSLDESITVQKSASTTEVVFGPADPAHVKYGDTFIQVYHPGTGRTLLLRVSVLQKAGSGAFRTAPQIAAGNLHTVALRTDGTVWAWGENKDGQLGDGTFISRAYPVQMRNTDGTYFEHIKAVAAGDRFSVLLNEAGEVIIVGALTSITTNLIHQPSAEELIQTWRAAQPMTMLMYRTEGKVYKPFTQAEIDKDGEPSGYSKAGTITRVTEWRDASGKRSANQSPTKEQILAGGLVRYYFGYYDYINENGDNCGKWSDIPDQCPNPHCLNADGSHTHGTLRRAVDAKHKVDYLGTVPVTFTVKYDAQNKYSYTEYYDTATSKTVIVPLNVAWTDTYTGLNYWVSRQFVGTEAIEGNAPKAWQVMLLQVGQVGASTCARKVIQREVDYFNGKLNCEPPAGRVCKLTGYDPLDTVTPFLCGFIPTGSTTSSCDKVGQGSFTLLYEDRVDVWNDAAHQNTDVDWHSLPETEQRYRIWRCQNNHTWIEYYDKAIDTAVPEVKKLVDENGAMIRGALDIDAGRDHVLALMSDNAATTTVNEAGTIYAAGVNDHGELGQNNTQKIGTAVPIKGFKAKGNLTNVVDIAGGDAYSMALLSNGTVYTWGDNSYGQLGNEMIPTVDGTIFHNYSTTPVQVNSGDYRVDGSATFRVISGVTAIAAGDRHAVVIANENIWDPLADSGKGAYYRASGVFAWGDNRKGQLAGVPSTTLLSKAPVRMNDLLDATAVSAGESHTLVRLPQPKKDPLALTPPATVSAVLAFGDNSRGQLGNNRAAAPIYATVAAGEWSATATELNEVSLVAAGGNFSLVMLENGRVMTWGDNTSGQLGLAAAGTGTAGAETVDDLKGVPYYAGEHEAEILEISFSGGTVTSRTDTSLTGVTLKYDPNLSNSTTILDTAKRYSHFGFNLLSNNTAVSSVALGTAYPGIRFVSSDESILVVEKVGNAWKMHNAAPSYSSFRKIGDVSVAAVDNTGKVVSVFRVRVQDGAKASPMVLGTKTGTLALKANGDVYFWGTYIERKLDPASLTKPGVEGPAVPTYLETKVEKTQPFQLPIQNIVQIAVGDGHYVALSADGKVYAWGDNTYGQTGVYESTPAYYKTVVANVTEHTGDAGTENKPVLKDLNREARTEYVTLSAGNDLATHLAGRKQNPHYVLDDLGQPYRDKNGNVVTDSAHYYDADNGPISLPFMPSYTGSEQKTTIVGVAAGGNHTLLLDSAGGVWSMGDNSHGQLGVGDKGLPHDTLLPFINNPATNKPSTRYTPERVLKGVSASDTPYLANIIKIDAGYGYSMALRADGTLYTWGANDKGQLGVVSSGDVMVPVEVAAPTEQTEGYYM